MSDSACARALVPFVVLSLAAAIGGCDGARLESSLLDNGIDPACSGDVREGCPCVQGHVVACYPEAPLEDAQSGDEFCVQGARRCQADGAWGPCEYSDAAKRLPIIGDPEMCGGCDPGCWRVHDCPVETDLTAENSSGVRFDIDAKGLVLGGRIANARYAFVANSPESTVSKISLETGVEVGRYLVGLQANVVTTKLGTVFHNDPSRTAIDAQGNAYVASRAFYWQGAVTKLAGDEGYCLDRNLNGKIDTSTGGTDVKTWGTDECVLWTVNVGTAGNHSSSEGSVPRALVVDASNRVWVGLYNSGRFDILDSADGHVLGSVSIGKLRPYGAAIGGDGKLWFPDGWGDGPTISYIDTTTSTFGKSYTPSKSSCDGSYGIAVDTTGRVIVGGASNATTGYACVSRYDPATKNWDYLATTGGLTRGVTIDGAGRVWAAHHDWSAGPHWLTSWDAAGTKTTYTLRTPAGVICQTPIGVGAGFDGAMWAVCQGTNRIVKLIPETGAISMYSTGDEPYTYSDFTGFLRANVTAPEGSYTRLYDSQLACSGGREPFWDELWWDAEAPTGTEIVFWARATDNLAQLGLSPEIELATLPGDSAPADLEQALIDAGLGTDLRYLEIRVQLRSLDGTSSPIFRNMDSVFYCRCTCDVDATCTTGCACDMHCI